MKKFVVAISAILYLGLSSGVVINMHYCMGRLLSVAYGHEKSEGCSNCGMKEKKGCCETDTKIVRIQDDQQMVKYQVFFSSELQTAVITDYHFSAEQGQRPTHVFSGYESPPDKRLNAVFRYNRSFLI